MSRMTLALPAIIGLFSSSTALAAPPLSGAIFTTDSTGTAVNGNTIYSVREDVYLDGGPGPNAPASAAGLPEGDYYFQVTDPSGQDLLSTDHISCRRFHVNEYGVIDHYYTDGSNYTLQVTTTGRGRARVTTLDWVPTACSGHATATDADHGDAPENAIVVQLFPYDFTTNEGGVYKVWITPVDDYVAAVGSIIDPTVACDGLSTCNVNGEDYHGGYFHGFVPSAAKTDNFKLDETSTPCEPPTLLVKKFDDVNGDGEWGEDEPELSWKVYTIDVLGVEDAKYTPVLVTEPNAGIWSVEEDLVSGWEQTSLSIDGVPTTVDYIVDLLVAGECGEFHDVVFGNHQVTEPPPECPVVGAGLGTASPYNVFVLGDYVGYNTDIGGRAAVGGFIDFTSVGVGSALGTSSSDVLSGGSDLDFTWGQVYAGDARIAGTCALNGVGHPAGVFSCEDSGAFDAASATTEMQDLALALAERPANGTVSATPWGQVYLTGSDTTSNVFDLDLDAVLAGFQSGITQINYFNVNVPAGSTTIINVRGDSSPFLKNGSIDLIGATSATTVFNFGSASSLSISGVGVNGSILAPFASVAFNNAHINGTLVAGSITGNGESHNVLFNGTLCP